MAKFFGLTSLANMFKIIRHNGGLRASTYKLFRMDSLRMGKLVGIDELGNKYYENNSFFLGRNRWVEYAPYFRLEYDASQVTPEWYGWLHYKTDYLPDEDPCRPTYKWTLPPTENLSGTEGQYMPYSTTKPKIQPWIPPKQYTD